MYLKDSLVMNGGGWCVGILWCGGGGKRRGEWGGWMMEDGG